MDSGCRFVRSRRVAMSTSNQLRGGGGHRDGRRPDHAYPVNFPRFVTVSDPEVDEVELSARARLRRWHRSTVSERTLRRVDRAQDVVAGYGPSPTMHDPDWQGLAHMGNPVVYDVNCRFCAKSLPIDYEAMFGHHRLLAQSTSAATTHSLGVSHWREYLRRTRPQPYRL
jgi:hypothetical protein